MAPVNMAARVKAKTIPARVGRMKMRLCVR